MKKFISIILGFIILVSYFLLTINICFSNLFSKSNIKKVMNKVDVTNTTTENIEIESTIDTLYDISKDYDISKEQVDKYLNSEETKEFISGYMENFTNNILKDSNTKITKEFLEEELKNSVDKFIKNNDYSDHTNERIKKLFDDNTNKIIENMPTTDKIEEYIDMPLINYLKIFLNNTTRIILIISILISTTIIILINLKTRKYLKYLGVIFLVSNIFTLLFGFVIKPAISYMLDYNTNIIITLLSGFANSIFIDYMIISITGIIISIVLIILYKIFKK